MLRYHKKVCSFDTGSPPKILCLCLWKLFPASRTGFDARKLFFSFQRKCSLLLVCLCNIESKSIHVEFISVFMWHSLYYGELIFVFYENAFVCVWRNHVHTHPSESITHPVIVVGIQWNCVCSMKNNCEISSYEIKYNIRLNWMQLNKKKKRRVLEEELVKLSVIYPLCFMLLW